MPATVFMIPPGELIGGASGSEAAALRLSLQPDASVGPVAGAQGPLQQQVAARWDPNGSRRIVCASDQLITSP